MKKSTRVRMLRVLNAVKQEKVKKEEAVRKSIIEKQRLIEEIKEVMGKYRRFAVIGLEKTPSKQYKRIKKELEKYGFIKAYKNSIFLRALKELGVEGVEDLEKVLTGTNAFFFTNLNPYEIALMVGKLVDLKFASPGDVATSEIYVPEGPTGIPPGPMLSVFGKLKLRTQVREGVIWIAKETKVAKPGDVISPELASLLRKLGIKPIEVRLNIKAVWDEGKVIPAEELAIDVEQFRKDLLLAVGAGRELAIETAMPLPEILPDILARAHMRAMALASEAGYVTPETAEAVLSAALRKAMALGLAIQEKQPDFDLGIEIAAAPAQPQQQEEKKEEEEEEEEEKEEISEEEIAEGIGSLFG